MKVVSRYFIHKSGLHCLSSVSTAIIRFNSHITNGRSHVFRSRGYIHCYFNLLQRPPCYNRPSRNLRRNNLSCNLHFGSNLGPLAIMERFDCRYCCGLWPETHICVDVCQAQWISRTRILNILSRDRAFLVFSPNFKGRLILPVDLADQTSSVFISARFIRLE